MRPIAEASSLRDLQSDQKAGAILSGSSSYGVVFAVIRSPLGRYEHVQIGRAFGHQGIVHLECRPWSIGSIADRFELRWRGDDPSHPNARIGSLARGGFVQYLDGQAD